jgi:hypothetical protein
VEITKVPIQNSAIKAFLHFWNLEYHCFTFGDVARMRCRIECPFGIIQVYMAWENRQEKEFLSFISGKRECESPPRKTSYV